MSIHMTSDADLRAEYLLQLSMGLSRADASQYDRAAVLALDARDLSIVLAASTAMAMLMLKLAMWLESGVKPGVRL